MADPNNPELLPTITRLNWWNVAAGVVAPQAGAFESMSILFSVIGEDARIIDNLTRINNNPPGTLPGLQEPVNDEIIYQLLAYPVGQDYQRTVGHIDPINYGLVIGSYYSGWVPVPDLLPPESQQYWLPGSYILTIDVTRKFQVQVGIPNIFQEYHGRAIVSFQV